MTLENAPNYYISLLGCDHVDIRGVTIRNGYSDGIDPDCCRHVRITGAAWSPATTRLRSRHSSPHSKATARQRESHETPPASRSLPRRTYVHTLYAVRLEWDSRKAAANLRTHGVSFAEAVTVLEDDFALTREDPRGRRADARRISMKKVAAEKYRNIDFAGARRGAVVRPEPGKTKISIRLDNTVIEHFRKLVEKAGGGNYQTLINDALLEHIHRRSTLDVVREVVREELAPYRVLGALRRKRPWKGQGARRHR